MDGQDVDVSHEDCRLALKNIELLRNATLDDSGLDEETIARIREPAREVSAELSDPDTLMSIELFLATINASEQAYEAAAKAFVRRCPTVKPLSFYKASMCRHVDMCEELTQASRSSAPSSGSQASLESNTICA